jgi:hypothetical protein
MIVFPSVPETSVTLKFPVMTMGAFSVSFITLVNPFEQTPAAPDILTDGLPEIVKSDPSGAIELH